MDVRLFKDAAQQLRISGSRQVMPDKVERSLVITRHFDTTPMFFRFGALEALISQHARYFEPVEEFITVGDVSTRHIRWKTVSYSEYRANHPRRACHAGVLEVLAQSTSAVLSKYSEPADWKRTYQTSREDMISPARLLQNGTGSNVHRCLEDSKEDTWDCAEVRTFSESKGVVILSETPDRGSSMLKLKHARAQHFADAPKVLYDEDSTCGVHLLHNALVKQTAEDDIVGHAHATHFVLKLEHRRRQLFGGLKHVISQDHIVFGVFGRSRAGGRGRIGEGRKSGVGVWGGGRGW